jgi:probable rRNA maturation factor
MLTVDCAGKLPAGVTRSTVQRLAGLALARAAKAGARVPKSASMSVRVTGDAEIRKLNRMHRSKDKVTDVLSFSATEGLPAAMRAAAGGELGDIVISLPQVTRQAKEIGRSTKAELALMIVHGTLHLLGYDHVSVKDEAKMFELQQDVLIEAGIL